jgi:DNA-binding transcriptional LysR family regulator
LTFACPDQTPTPGITAQTLFADEVFAVMPAGDGADASPDLVGLAREPWIAGCPRCRTHLIEVCRRAGFTPHIVHATDDYVAAQAMVAAGLGVTLLPALALAAYRHPDVTVHPLRPSAVRQVTACTVAADPLPPAVALVFEQLRAFERGGSLRREERSPRPVSGP